jgi:formylmethanofuran dehydrogenase subunit E
VTAAREIPIHRCVTCGDPIRSRRHAIVTDGRIFCCEPCYRTATAVVTR